MWEPHPNPYNIEVRDPEKKSKFKGIKTFTAYSIVPSVSILITYVHTHIHNVLT